MMRWLTQFIRENQAVWEERDRIRRKDMELTRIMQDWEELTEQEKMDKIKHEVKTQEEGAEMRKRRAESRSMHWKVKRDQKCEEGEVKHESRRLRNTSLREGEPGGTEGYNTPPREIRRGGGGPTMKAQLS